MKAAATFKMNGQVSGFTAACFWTASRRLIVRLEGPVGFRVLGKDSSLARLSPNRWLAGLRSWDSALGDVVRMLRDKK